MKKSLTKTMIGALITDLLYETEGIEGFEL